MGIAIQWPLVLFTFVAGIGGGLLIPAGIAQLSGKADKNVQFVASVLSVALLVVGGCFSLLHLASPQNVMAAVTNVFSFSGISMELILLGVCFVLAGAFAILVKRESSQVALRAIAVLGIVFGVLLLFFCGHGYVMASRPAWNTVTLPLAYMGTSLAGGAFAYGVVCVALKAGWEDAKALKLVLLACSVVCALTCAVYALSVAASSESSILLWVGVCGCGVVGVLASGIAAYLKLDGGNAALILAIGFALAVLAILAVRIVMWGTSAGYLELFDLAATVSPCVSIAMP